jgi:hypothetical protein
MVGGFIAVGKTYWFSVPVLGIGISLACYVASVVAALAWHRSSISHETRLSPCLIHAGEAPGRTHEAPDIEKAQRSK